MGSKEENNNFETLIESLGSTAKVSQPSSNVNYYVWPRLSQPRMFNERAPMIVLTHSFILVNTHMIIY